jgi:acyl-CoA thioesterase YciA
MPDEPAFPADAHPHLRRVTTILDSNLMGTVFGGAILSELDLAAAIEAHKLHARPRGHRGHGQGGVQAPVYVGDLLSLYTDTDARRAQPRSRCASRWAQRRKPPRDTVQVTEALVTMVAVDDALNPVPVRDP